MTQPTSHVFGGLPARSCASVVVLKEIVGSVHIFFVVISALCVSTGDTGMALARVTAVGLKPAAPHHVCHCPAKETASGCRRCFGRGLVAKAAPAATSAAARTTATTATPRRSIHR